MSNENPVTYTNFEFGKIRKLVKKTLFPSSIGGNKIMVTTKRFKEENVFETDELIGKYDQTIRIKSGENRRINIEIFNKDKSEALLCVNGLFAIANYLIRLRTLMNIEETVTMERFLKHSLIEVYNKKCPKIYAAINFLSANRHDYYRILVNLPISHLAFIDLSSATKGDYYVNVGNTFCITTTRELEDKPLNLIIVNSIQILNKDWLPTSVVSPADYHNIDILVQEKGAGFTSSCGSAGMAIAYLIMKLKGWANGKIIVSYYTKSGTLTDRMKIKFSVPDIFKCVMEKVKV